MSPLEAAWLATKDRLPGMDFEQFSKALEGADVHPVYVESECVGAVVVMRYEVHACVLPKAKGRWIQKRHLKILSDILHKYGVALTSATTIEGVEFVKRLGFRQIGDKWLKGLSYGS